MQGNKIHTFSFFFFLPFLLSSSCGLDTSLTDLGGDVDVTPPNLQDDFVIEFALREEEEEGEEKNRTIVIQARKFESPMDNLGFLCGADGAFCDCQLFTITGGEDEFILSEKKSLNEELNTLECEIPESIEDPIAVTHVRIVNEGILESLRSGKIRISSVLSLAEIVRDSDPGTIRKIYRYACSRTFLEGEGVSRNFTITCLNGMRLAFLLATYNFYLFSQVNEEANNFSDRGNVLYYEGDNNGLVCGLRIPDYSCGLAENSPIFGIASESTELFSLGIIMTPYPNFEVTEETPVPIYGYAAVPDSNLNCPPGLVKASARVAVPASHVDPNLGSDSSNFVNETGALNDNIYLTLSEDPLNFRLQKRPDDGPCTCDRQQCICPNPRTGTETIQIAPYENRTPVFCVIPREIL